VRNRALLICGVLGALALWPAADLSAGAGASAAAPSCAEGPRVSSVAIVGTPCADRIVVPPWIDSVQGGAGNDTIVAAPLLSAQECPAGCQLGTGSQTFEGGPGDDVVYGERGNDTLLGGAGNDRLYGGVGDDLLLGGPGNDRLSGGHGADSIDGEGGNDYVRGDGTIDHIFDTGGGFDTLSYSTGITPGFEGGAASAYAGFPAGPEGRGVRLELGAGGENGDDGFPWFGGGADRVEGQSFERIIGTPYADYIVGTEAAETIYGGGGADVILGKGGDDALRGGADGDDIDGGTGANDIDGGPGEDHCQNATGAISCETSSKAVVPGGGGAVEVGFMVPAAEQEGGTQLYVTGSEGDDAIVVDYSPSEVVFTLAKGSFDLSAAAAGGCGVTATEATCPLTAPLDSLVIAGMGGDDTVVASDLPSTVGLLLTGGTGDDSLTGGEASEDSLVDGPGSGADKLFALGRDDVLIHNGGADQLFGGAGNDLFLSFSICDGELLSGGAGRDNSSWARLGEGVDARLDLGLAGHIGPGDQPVCSGGTLDTMQSVEDLEGSEFGDVLYGDDAVNHILGHLGADTYVAGGGNDTLLANSADSDPVLDCGEGSGDVALIDIPHPPEYVDAAPVNCETVGEEVPESFRLPTRTAPPPPPEPEVEVEAKPRPAAKPIPDRTAPQTRITLHPSPALTSAHRTRVVSFRFSSNESGSGFKCRLDARPYRRCTSPRSFRVGLGHHAVRVIAIDPAGNADRSPALFAFQVKARHLGKPARSSG
jgi:Ca2+-binding RTX toxin-like protein